MESGFDPLIFIFRMLSIAGWLIVFRECITILRDRKDDLFIQALAVATIFDGIMYIAILFATQNLRSFKAVSNTSLFWAVYNFITPMFLFFVFIVLKRHLNECKLQ